MCPHGSPTRSVGDGQRCQDFDPLRKGYCAASQVKTVLTILNLSKIVTREDYDQLLQTYCREDGMFCYGDFCADVNKVFATPNLEKDELPAMAEAAINVGDRVAVGETKLLGTVKFVGKTEFATGDWMGIELDEKAGKNDGQAMEDHDVEALRRILPVANNLGINPKEVDAAKRILSFEVQQSLVEEVEMVRSTVTHLAESVAKVEEQAARQHPAVAGLLQRLGPELEKRLWSRLQPSIDRIVTGVLDKVSASLEGRARSMDLAEKAEVPAATTGSLGLEAYTFRHFDLNGDGFITQDEFDEVRAKILSGQPLPKVEPAAALEEQQVAASKIQAVYRGRAAREQVPRKKGEATDSLTGKLPTDAEKELAKVICRSVYSKIALTSQDSQAPSSDEREAARYVVNHVLEKAMEAQPAK
eukprot:g31793.t1